MTGSEVQPPDEPPRAAWQKLLADTLILCGVGAAVFMLLQ